MKIFAPAIGQAAPRRLVGLLLTLLLALFLALMLGTEIATPGELLAALLDPTDPFAVLLRDWRLPRVLAAFLVGACLAMSGAIFQGVFKNPLAEPYLLGSASGAAVGAAIALLVPLPVSQSIALPILAFSGAWGATWLVIAIARAARTNDTASLLLAGVAVAAILGAARSLVMLALSDDTVNLQVVLSWSLGGIQTPYWRELGLLAGLAGLAAVLSMHLARGLDLLGLGDDVAENMGLDTRAFLNRAVLAGSAITAIAVSWGGLIGFIGLVVPHVVRWRIGVAHARLIPAAALLGGGALMLLDGIARSALPPAEIPLGLITALVGAPFFLAILARGQR